MDIKGLRRKPSAKWVAWFIGKSKILVHFHNQGRVVGGKERSVVTADAIKQANKHYETIWEIISKILQTRNKEELGELFKQLIKELK